MSRNYALYLSLTYYIRVILNRNFVLQNLLLFIVRSLLKFHTWHNGHPRYFRLNVRRSNRANSRQSRTALSIRELFRSLIFISVHEGDTGASQNAYPEWLFDSVDSHIRVCAISAISACQLSRCRDLTSLSRLVENETCNIGHASKQPVLRVGILGSETQNTRRTRGRIIRRRQMVRSSTRNGG